MEGGGQNKGVDMKKIVLFAIIAAITTSANASDYYETTIRDCNPAAMRAALDKASYDRRAVITVVSCNNGGAYYYDAKDNRDAIVTVESGRNVSVTPRRVVGRRVCADCTAPIERVVSRRHYVEETIQRYQPVVQYVPAGTYTRTRRVCSTCDM